MGPQAQPLTRRRPARRRVLMWPASCLHTLFPHQLAPGTVPTCAPHTSTPWWGLHPLEHTWGRGAGARCPLCSAGHRVWMRRGQVERGFGADSASPWGIPLGIPFQVPRGRPGSGQGGCWSEGWWLTERLLRSLGGVRGPLQEASLPGWHGAGAAPCSGCLGPETGPEAASRPSPLGHFLARGP